MIRLISQSGYIKILLSFVIMYLAVHLHTDPVLCDVQFAAGLLYLLVGLKILIRKRNHPAQNNN